MIIPYPNPTKGARSGIQSMTVLCISYLCFRVKNMPMTLKNTLRWAFTPFLSHMFYVLFVQATFLFFFLTLSSETETTFHFCWRVISSFKMVWMESTLPCNALISHSLRWRCCSLVWPKSLFSKTGFDHLGRDQSSFWLSALLYLALSSYLYAFAAFSNISNVQQYCSNITQYSVLSIPKLFHVLKSF